MGNRHGSKFVVGNQVFGKLRKANDHRLKYLKIPSGLAGFLNHQLKTNLHLLGICAAQFFVGIFMMKHYLSEIWSIVEHVVLPEMAILSR